MSQQSSEKPNELAAGASADNPSAAPVESAANPETASNPETAVESATVANPPETVAAGPSGASHQHDPLDGRRWWAKLLVQPLLLLICAATAIAGLGVAQRLGWISAGGSGSGDGAHAAPTAAAVDYICPMMCTPPQKEPGRCPVCAMELVPAAAGGSGGDERSIQVDPASRRVANIHTVPVKSMPVYRTMKTVGELAYDESTLRTIAAWTGGRLDRLYADYTGVVVNKGDHLALVYSPELYSGQVELLLAKKARSQESGNSRRRALLSSGDLYDSARERLIELGMTEDQIAEIERTDKASSRMHLCAPISGTVIEKFAVEGQYVKEGDPIYKLADLSTVWLMLELFPDDAATIRYGQMIEAQVQSFPGRSFPGRVAFIDPQVDPKTRTVGVRVVIPNPDGLLRVGDYAKASIRVPVTGVNEQMAELYDPELAGKWISPRHPHIVKSSPGQCPLCGIDLVPASRFGFCDQPQEANDVLTVPRNAILMAGEHSVVYVETDPGRFEIRRVVLGPGIGEEIAVLKGLAAGEQVATSGNFLIDSQMQLAGNPSLIDPTRAASPGELPEALSAEMLAEIETLPVEDREPAKAQLICPITEMKLGSMGPPIKVDVNGQPVFICCEGCRESLLDDPETYLAKLAEPRSAAPEEEDNLEMELPPMGAMELPSMGEWEFVPLPIDLETAAEDEAEIIEALAQFSPEDRRMALRQKTCPVANMKLGSMGPPIKVDVNGRPVFICCEGCRKQLLAEPEKHLARLPKEAVR